LIWLDWINAAASGSETVKPQQFFQMDSNADHLFWSCTHLFFSLLHILKIIGMVFRVLMFLTRTNVVSVAICYLICFVFFCSDSFPLSLSLSWIFRTFILSWRNWSQNNRYVFPRLKSNDNFSYVLTFWCLHLTLN
jgi:hypothetical protein